MLKRVKDLTAGDYYDAYPLCEGQLEPFGTDARDDSIWVAAECIYFEVEEVERMRDGNYVIWGEPHNMTANGDEVVAVDIRRW